MTDQPDELFDGLPAMSPPAREVAYCEPKRKKHGHAWKPGTGPEGETCRSCVHSVKRGGTAGSFYKCALMRDHWTGGAATDILLRDPACKFWVKATPGIDKEES